MANDRKIGGEGWTGSGLPIDLKAWRAPHGKPNLEQAAQGTSIALPGESCDQRALEAPEKTRLNGEIQLPTRNASSRRGAVGVGRWGSW